MPEYTDGTDINSGIQCWVCDGTKTKILREWGQYFEHMCLTHKTDCPMDRWRHTAFYRMGRESINQRVRRPYKRPATDGTVWHRMDCMVLCSMDGTPVVPHQVQPLKIKKARQLAIADASPAPELTVAHAQPAAAAGGASRPAAQPLPLSAPATLVAAELPAVHIKDVYYSYFADAANEDVSRNTWPGGCADVPLTAFADHLQQKRFMNPTSHVYKNHLLYMRRFFHMLIVDDGDTGAVNTDEAAMDPRLFASAFLRDTILIVFALPMMNLKKVTYPDRLVKALCMYLGFMLNCIEIRALVDPTTTMYKYKPMIERLRESLKEGIQKHINKNSKVRKMVRMQIDRLRCEKLPTPREMKDAVHNAMCVLQHLVAHATTAGETTPKVRQSANVCIVGIVAMNGYLGRKKEWEHLERDQYRTEIAKNKWWITTDKHKTFRVYGTLGKVVFAGTRESMLAYDSLPRGPGQQHYFFAQPNTADVVINVPYLLGAFSKFFFFAAEQHPTVNLLRKWFHTSLMDRPEEKLLEVLKAVDPHSNQVMKNHYILKGPKEHAIMAERLYKSVMGDPVPWPIGADGDLRGRLRGVGDAEADKILQLVEDEQQERLVNAQIEDAGEALFFFGSSIALRCFRNA